MADGASFFRLIPLACLFFSGCLGVSTSNDGNSESRRVLRSLSESDRQVIEKDNIFGINLYSDLASDSIEGNLLISPLSVSMVLTMAYNGARGTTETAMRTSLGHIQIDKEKINNLYKKLLPALSRSDADVEVTIANSIWSQQGFTLEKEFTELNHGSFGADIVPVDFRDVATPAVINLWAKEKTQGLIKEIIQPPLNENLKLVLVNALFFNGKWSHPFNPKATISGLFRKEDGTEKSVAMMTAQGTFHCFDDGAVRGLRLAYGDSLFSMILILPPQGENISQFLGELTIEKWKQWMASFAPQDGKIFVPKFKFEFSRSIVEDLKRLGMEEAFAEGADFSGIHSQGGLFLSEVRQKTFIKVDEEGTEAGAATSVGINPTGDPKELIRLNRPYVFAILEKSSGALPFLGWVKEPVF